MNPDHNTTTNEIALEFPAPALSESGLARRDEMLGALMDSMAGLHRRRTSRRRMAAAACLAMVALAAAMLALSFPQREGSPNPRQTLAGAPAGLEPAPGAGVGDNAALKPLIVRVSTDPAILDRLRAHPARVVRRVGDAELMRALAAMDRPAGLIRMGDRVRLTAPVTDAELSLRLP